MQGVTFKKSIADYLLDCPRKRENLPAFPENDRHFLKNCRRSPGITPEPLRIPWNADPKEPA